MKLIDNVDMSLFESPTNIEEELRKLTRAGIFKAEIVRAIESAIVIVNAYADAREEDYV